jgi:hypothetical protein
LSINELNRIYINDALTGKQLCEIVLSESTKHDHNPFQIAFIDDARSIIIGGNSTAMNAYMSMIDSLKSTYRNVRYFLPNEYCVTCRLMKNDLKERLGMH